MAKEKLSHKNLLESYEMFKVKKYFQLMKKVENI